MHSCEFRVKDEWMRAYQTSLKSVVRQFRHVAQMKTVGQQIQEVSEIFPLTASECFKSETRRSFCQTPSEGTRFMFGDFVSLFVQMLTVDLSICVSGLDRMDSTLPEEIGSDSVHQISGDIISQWEAELLQERLQELLRAANDAAAEDDDNTKSQVRRTHSTIRVHSLDRIHSY